MRKIIKLLIFIPVMVFVFSGFFRGTGAVDGEKSSISMLIAGFDDAAENTDVLFILSYNKDENFASVVQIPRDTYCNSGDDECKINSFYSRSRAIGHSADDAMELLTKRIEEFMGIEINSYLGLSGNAFSDLVDDVGGVSLNIPDGFPIEGHAVDLKHGENHLNGKESLAFVRHRASYLTADLGRMDAQKLFISALFETIFEKIDIKCAVSLLSKKSEGLVADFDISELLPFLISARNGIKSAEIVFLTLPGEAALYDDIWYYVINKTAAEDSVFRYINSKSDSFDKKRNFTNSEISEINNIYTKQMQSYKVYINDKINDIKIERKAD